MHIKNRPFAAGRHGRKEIAALRDDPSSRLRCRSDALHNLFGLRPDP
jgi:hypothetical protein